MKEADIVDGEEEEVREQIIGLVEEEVIFVCFVCFSIVSVTDGCQWTVITTILKGDANTWH